MISTSSVKYFFAPRSFSTISLNWYVFAYYPAPYQTLMSSTISCPKCLSQEYVKSGSIKGRQRYKCKSCNYYFSVQKLGKKINDYVVIKALQLYIEGISYREIERILGVSHVSVMNWVKTYKMQRPFGDSPVKTSHKVLGFHELQEFIAIKENMRNSGTIITAIEDQFLVTTWKGASIQDLKQMSLPTDKNTI